MVATIYVTKLIFNYLLKITSRKFYNKLRTKYEN